MNGARMQSVPIFDRSTAVLLGNFNPAIFSPAWLSENELVSPEDAQRSTIQIIHPEICQFEVGQFNIMCDTQRFVVSCVTSQSEMIRDLITMLFGNMLKYTPMTALGMNRDVHFDVGDYWVRNMVGDELAPKSAWGEWSQFLTNEKKEPPQFSGLASISIREVHVEPLRGLVQATVQPSNLPNLVQTGIYLGINNHMELANQYGTSASYKLMSLIEAHWQNANDKSDFILAQVQTLVERCRKIKDNLK